LSGFLKEWHALGYPGIDDRIPILLSEWRIPGNRKGEAVLTMDPQDGPFTPLEIRAIESALKQAFEKGKISLRAFVLAWLFKGYGSRAVQIASLKLCDFQVLYAEDDSRTHLLNIPRAKMRNNLHRDEFKLRPMFLEIGKTVESLVDEVKKDAEAQFGRLPENPLELPLFPRWNGMSLRGFEHHSTGAEIANELKATVEGLGIISPRTGKPLRVTSRRFRRTVGTLAAQEGHPPLEIAEMLDHTDTQNVGVYAAVVPEVIERLDKALASQLAPLARAFAGQIVDDETAAERGDDPASRVAHPRFGCGTGTCGKHGLCAAAPAIGCYECSKFQAWLDGPHERVLEYLISERERLVRETGDKIIAHARDRTILAVSEVVQKCRTIKEQLKNER
jgi:integrase